MLQQAFDKPIDWQSFAAGLYTAIIFMALTMSCLYLFLAAKKRERKEKIEKENGLIDFKLRHGIKD